MEIYKIKNLSFTYPNRQKRAICDIDLAVRQGEFICVAGKSGCGKTTLLKLLKSSLSPHGCIVGEVLFRGRPLIEADKREQAAKIGFITQDVDNQIVCDKVWHEMAFGLESLGYTTPEIRTRVAEMAAFFGIEQWFHKKVTELSGGQKQLLNLASVMVMQPDVLILDEPTSQLDPIAADEFLKTLEKINRELGTTVILSEHRLDEALTVASRILIMESGRIIADGTAGSVGKILKEKNNDMYAALPVPMRVFGAVGGDGECPVCVREGRVWLEEYASENTLSPELIPKSDEKPYNEVCVELDDVWFRYEKELPDIIKGMNLKIYKGEIFAILGGNGSGKTTTLSLISGLNKAYRGKVRIEGKEATKIQNLYDEYLGVLPQNPRTLFVKKTVYLDLFKMLPKNMSDADKQDTIQSMAALCRISEVLGSHPYDLSGGEMQRAALCKVLLQKPKILLLDEPTKGIDAHFKEIFFDILCDLKTRGVTIIMVSHDIEFCAKAADKCALVFDGGITAVQPPREFFAGNSFYTTSANRMSRNILPNAVLAEDIIIACGKSAEIKEIPKAVPTKTPNTEKKAEPEKPKTSKPRYIAGCIFAVLFVLISAIQISGIGNIEAKVLQLVSGLTFAAVIICFFPSGDIGVNIQVPQNKRRLSKRTVVSTLLILLAIPLTMYIGIYYLGDRKYYFISMLIILETFLPFCMVFEGRAPQARELVLISVLCAIAVAGRMAFFMLPQFKPILAIIIICGICFGGETGFLVGAVTGFVSNFFFGQGPWTPWQMFALGIVGFLAGLLFKKGFLRKTRTSLCIFGFLATVVIYGGILNPSSVIMMQQTPTKELIIAAYAAGLPYDLIHAASTAFFLWFLSEPMIEKLERVKIKYGLIEK